MSSRRDIDPVNDFRALPAETAWVESKRNNDDPEMIGKLCSALSNSARLEGRENAYIVWGVEDGTHHISGTNFAPLTKKSVRKNFRRG
ncbi:ATP-binding protein [Paracoccus sp. DMF]|uniref:ATP-binding protein n=1 Tax=Paracoccus sp. DMF TaxID=400837 RepID=UPI0011014BB8|nr:ATP-binding protein [Paracoccus sp. DMF]MCV2447174.1 ATP-binding protein [Paracoccus sp. DMF]